jgi:hypothetical protein
MLNINGVRGVEQHIFSITPALWQVKGYFLDVGVDDAHGAYVFALLPISARRS